jgi:hypothetical protein
LENPSPNLSPARREALTFPSSLPGKGVRGLGFALAFLHGVKIQKKDNASYQMLYASSQFSPLIADGGGILVFRRAGEQGEKLMPNA